MIFNTAWTTCPLHKIRGNFNFILFLTSFSKCYPVNTVEGQPPCKHRQYHCAPAPPTPSPTTSPIVIVQGPTVSPVSPTPFPTTATPTDHPSPNPTYAPTYAPTTRPTYAPTNQPISPTSAPIIIVETPTLAPSIITQFPTASPRVRLNKCNCRWYKQGASPGKW